LIVGPRTYPALTRQQRPRLHVFVLPHQPVSSQRLIGHVAVDPEVSAGEKRSTSSSRFSSHHTQFFKAKLHAVLNFVLGTRMDVIQCKTDTCNPKASRSLKSATATRRALLSSDSTSPKTVKIGASSICLVLSFGYEWFSGSLYPSIRVVRALEVNEASPQHRWPW